VNIRRIDERGVRCWAIRPRKEVKPDLGGGVVGPTSYAFGKLTDDVRNGAGLLFRGRLFNGVPNCGVGRREGSGVIAGSGSSNG
jgi:hypothetical protein